MVIDLSSCLIILEAIPKVGGWVQIGFNDGALDLVASYLHSVHLFCALAKGVMNRPLCMKVDEVRTHCLKEIFLEMSVRLTNSLRICR